MEYLESSVPVHLDKLRKIRQNVEDSQALEVRMKQQTGEAREEIKKFRAEVEENKEVCLQHKGATALLNIAIA